MDLQQLISDEIEDLIESESEKDLQRARRLIEGMLRRLPDERPDALLHDQLGRTLWKLGRFAEAIQSFETAVSIAPGDYKKQHNLGVHLVRTGRLEEGEAPLLKALSLCENERTLGALLALRLLRPGEPSAKDLFQGLLRTPPNPIHYAILADAAYEFDDLPVLLEMTSRILDPTDEERPWFQILLSVTEEKIRADLGRADLRKEPRLVDAVILARSLLLQGGDEAQVFERLQERLTALKTKPPTPDPVTRMPGVCGGSPCIANTRIPVWVLVQARQMGRSDERVLRDYPSLEQRHLDAAWAYYEAHKTEIDAEIQTQDEE